MKKDEVLPRKLFDCVDIAEDGEVFLMHDMLSQYIPDLPTGVGIYINEEGCTHHAFNPVTMVLPALMRMFDLPTDDIPEHFASDTFYFNDFEDVSVLAFDIRTPEKFDYIAWLRATLRASAPQSKVLADRVLNYAVEREVFLTHYNNWLHSWRMRGSPIYLGYGMLSFLDSEGRVREVCNRDYPIDENLKPLD